MSRNKKFGVAPMPLRMHRVTYHDAGHCAECGAAFTPGKATTTRIRFTVNPATNQSTRHVEITHAQGKVCTRNKKQARQTAKTLLPTTSPGARSA